ncbi:WhiB family transcriptional regulator [Gordonia terrae]
MNLPSPLSAAWDWQLQARCRGLRVDHFFPASERTKAGRRGRERREQDALEVCRGCAVVERCREYALNAEEPYGVWGGLTEGERMEIIYFGAGYPSP